MRLNSAIAVLTTLALLAACGKGQVQVTNNSYEPRIVIEGVVLPGHPVGDIRIGRNFRVDENLRLAPSIVLSDADVVLVDEQDGRRFSLTFRDAQRSGDNYLDGRYEYPGDDLTIEHGNSYTLEVRATLEGEQLFARATTTVPAAGFRIAAAPPSESTYRQRDAHGDLINLELTIERSPGTTFYLMTATPLRAETDNFIYDNPFTDEKPGSLDLGDFNYNWEWIQNTPATAGRSTMGLFWWNLWFYGRHRIVVYAVDKNWSNFLQTFDEVQEEDGNFHEPLFKVEGDGIGYFGSAIADTVFIEVLSD